MKKTITILTFLSLLLTIWAALLWLLPSAADTTNTNKTRYGLNEGLELVELNNGATGKRYVVDDANGNELFTIPLRNCMLDTRYRNGQLRFRELATRCEGFIIVTVLLPLPLLLPTAYCLRICKLQQQ